MRRSSLLLTAFAIAFSFDPRIAAGQEFEGIIRERTIMLPPAALAEFLGGEPSPANVDDVFSLDVDQLLASAGPAGSVQVMERTTYVSGGKLRAEVQQAGMDPFGGTALILDRDAGTITMLIPVVRSYMVLDEALLRDQLGMLAGAYMGMANFPAPSIEPLGSATIAGVEAEGYEIRAGDAFIARGWAAPELRNALPPQPQIDDPLAALAERGLPVRIHALMRSEGPLASFFGSGYVYYAMEVLSAERTTVDPALFTVPPDYTPVDTGGAIPGTIGPPGN